MCWIHHDWKLVFWEKSSLQWVHPLNLAMGGTFSFCLKLPRNFPCALSCGMIYKWWWQIMWWDLMRDITEISYNKIHLAFFFFLKKKDTSLNASSKQMANFDSTVLRISSSKYGAKTWLITYDNLVDSMTHYCKE